MDLQAPRDAVVVETVHKWYRVYASPTDRLKRVIGRPSRHLDFQALDDVSFRVPAGTAMGLIGENGAGKTTLLKLIAGTTRPSAGSIEAHGVVAAILELGAAFHPEFSGRDNAVLYGALMGLDRGQMERRLDAIIDFAELGDFIEHPIKSYSTGMAMRLAFAVATHVDPDVLVVDEALAVGDGYFQKKCVDRIRQIHDSGTTILFCSHSMYLVTLFCDTALWLANGRMQQLGPAKDVVRAYEDYLLQREKRRLGEGDDRPDPAAGRRPGRITDLSVEGGGDRPSGSTAELVIDVRIDSVDVDEAYHVGLSINTIDGHCVFTAGTHVDGRAPLRGSTEYGARLVIPFLPLADGTYSLTGYLLDDTGLAVHDQVVSTEALRVSGERWDPAILDVDHHWTDAP
jgi:lipopolysaccharide transport system ATP-binding protein